MKKITAFIFILLALYCAAFAAPPLKKPVYERELFRAERFRPVPDADYGAFKLVNTSVKVRGAALKGWILRKENPSGLLIYYYGNSESVNESKQKLFTLAQNTSFDILCLDYRSYGSSSGTPSIDFMLEDSLEIYDRYASFYMDVFVYGHSLGTIPALHTAIERRVNGVILEAAFTTAKEAVPGTDYYLPWPLNNLITLEASKELSERKPQQFERIMELNTPLLVLHGSEDALFPPEMGSQMFNAAPVNDKTFALIQGAGHHNMDIGTGGAKDTIFSFLSGHSGNPFSASVKKPERIN